MSLSCRCDFEFDYWAEPDTDFSISSEACRCHSCGQRIKAGDTVLKFTCWREADDDSDDPLDVEAIENGSYQVDYPDEFHCERCGEIYMNLSDAGYCLSSGDHMPSLLKEYQALTGFDPWKYKELEGASQMENLKPCPFCGHTSVYIDACNENFADPFLQVRCDFCGMGGPCSEKEEEAKALWNALPRREEDV